MAGNPGKDRAGADSGDHVSASGPFTKLQSRSRADQVRDQLGDAIANGTYPVGAKLPSERILTEMLGVSRVSLREGLRSLEAVGLIEVRHGDGYYVTATRAAPRVDAIKWLGEHHTEVMDMMLVRGALDEVAAAEAAQRATPEQVLAIREAHEAFVAAVRSNERDLKALADLDVAFHLSIVDATGSSMLIDLLGELHHHLREARSVGFTPVGRLELSASEHQAIFDAIAASDADAAKSATATHIAHVKQLLGALEE